MVPEEGFRLADLQTIAPQAATVDPRLLTPAAWDIERLYRFLLDHRPAVHALLGRTRQFVNTEMVIRHYYRWIRNNTRMDGSALDKLIREANL